MRKKRIIVAISGASGAILGIRLLQELQKKEIESHLILSDWGARTIEIETAYTAEEVRRMADVVYPADDLAAAISSGSFLTDGMVVSPCSMKTLSAIANGFSHNLIARAADVCLKEKRKLLLLPRETPLNSIHLRNMAVLSDMGAVIMPPLLSMYSKPQSIDDIICHIVGKMMDSLGIDNELTGRWNGLS